MSKKEDNKKEFWITPQESNRSDGLVVRLPVAKAAKRQQGTNRIVVFNCPYCNGVHYHGDGTHDGSGIITGARVADCGKGQYELEEITKTIDGKCDEE